MFNGHKSDGDPEGELPGDNGEGDHENGKGDRTVAKGQCPVLKGEPLGEEEPDLFVSVFVFWALHSQQTQISTYIFALK